VTEIRVIFGDTDQMGVVYHANYLRWFEASRATFLRNRGRSYAELEAMGYGLPVVEAHVCYKRPAKYDDLVSIVPTLVEVKAASFRFSYQALRGEELLSDGWTLHACIDRTGRARRLPDEVRRVLATPLL
jgi:acyl-CoA thioester hydrolase